MKEKLIDYFIKYLSLNIIKKVFITYLLCWIGFLFSFSLGKFLLYLSSILKNNYILKPAKVAQTIGTAKFTTVSHTISKTVGVKNMYLDYSLSYIISNFTSCLIIIFALATLGYLYKKDLEKVRSIKEKEEIIKNYTKYLFILFVFTVINPLTGLIGINLKYLDLIVVLPHGLFEFLGFAIAIVVGLEIANKICPIVKKNISYKKIMALILCSFIFIFIAGMLEPIDWAIYYYSQIYNIPLLHAIITIYKHLLLSLVYII
ncbi:hypothetical protein [Methanocaldococcus sp.]|uniref:hypothetical protein n=1 Tax=Methanocaldococcus sp. TaxID=2152917 RepID=UPI00262E6184|nr:hypothetical protein [Methanocaldococcus sp.]MCQ6253667.1 hypothetical protein [Methanocaldococcus sp.]